MEVKAIIKGVRISPIKLRLTADMIRGKSVSEAKNIVNNYNSKPARIIKKALEKAGKPVLIKDYTVSISGEII